MELSILDTKGLPAESVLSVRSGPTRRQCPLPYSAPFRLPAGPWPLRIDVLGLLGRSLPGASLAGLDASGCCRVPLETSDGQQMSVTLQVFDGKAGGVRPKACIRGEPEPEAEASPASPHRVRESDAEARSYLDRHRLHEFMHSLFELLLRDQPEDPYLFMAARFKEAALNELAPQDLATILPLKKVSAVAAVAAAPSSVSTAPTIVPTPYQEGPSSPLPEDTVQVLLQTMAGRNLLRIQVPLQEQVGTLKKRLEARLGVPASFQHLLWWAETLPNATTLEEHGISAGPATVHLTLGTRNPRLLRAVSGSSEGGLRLWSLEDGEMIQDFGIGGPAAVLAVAVHWQTMRALTGSFDGHLRLWDLRSGDAVAQRVIEAHKDEVSTVEVEWTRMLALSGSGDGTAKLWSLEDGSCAQTLIGGSGVGTLAVNWASDKAFGGLRNGRVRLWDLASGALLQEFSGGADAAAGGSSAVSAVAIDCVGLRAVSGFEDGRLAYWRLAEPSEGAAAGGEPGAAGNAPAAKRPAAAAKLHTAHFSAIRAITARWGSGTENRALCGSDDGSLSLWLLETQECLARFGRHIGFVWTIYADWARERAFSGAFDGCLKLWDLRTGHCLRTIQAHSRPVRGISAG